MYAAALLRGVFLRRCNVADFKATLMDETAVLRALKRISHEIVEKNGGAENIVIVGIKRRGVPLAKIISKNIREIENISVPVGVADITFYRDDLKHISDEPVINRTEFGFDVTGKTVILVDDVLYTGRTARAAMEAVMSAGRAAAIRLAILVDRGHRELPVRGDFVGKNVPTSKNERIAVKIPPIDNITAVELYG